MSAALKQEVETDRPSFTLIEGGRNFRDQVEALAPRLLPRAVQLCHNRHDAQDLVQDTVERALRFEHHFLIGSNLRAWLNQVLFSVFVTRCRSRGRERRALDNLGNDPCAWTNADPAPLMRTLTPRLAQALASLPQPFADALLLVDLEELPYKDAAIALQVPVGTIMSRLHRGRRLLREALGEDVAA
jgi:RNA polymerase sigma-70 factor, ECF subfamily